MRGLESEADPQLAAPGIEAVLADAEQLDAQPVARERDRVADRQPRRRCRSAAPRQRRSRHAVLPKRDHPIAAVASCALSRMRVRRGCDVFGRDAKTGRDPGLGVGT